MNITAKLSLIKNHTGKIIQNRKEKHFYSEYAIIEQNHAFIVVRFYATKVTTYCCAWINDAGTNTYVSGGGKAGGGGYHKASAALESALLDAGIELSNSISGDSAMESALKAVANALGYQNYYLHIAHA